MNMELIIKNLNIECKKSIKTGDVPVGAILVKNGVLISKGHNTREKSKSILGHAEINCINKATRKLRTWHLDDCELYVTLKPCTMCESIIKNCHIKKVYYICEKLPMKHEYSKTDFLYIKTQYEIEYIDLLKNFFVKKRKQ